MRESDVEQLQAIFRDGSGVDHYEAEDQAQGLVEVRGDVTICSQR